MLSINLCYSVFIIVKRCELYAISMEILMNVFIGILDSKFVSSVISHTSS